MAPQQYFSPKIRVTMFAKIKKVGDAEKKGVLCNMQINGTSAIFLLTNTQNHDLFQLPKSSHMTNFHLVIS